MREIKFRAWDKDKKHFWYFTLQEILERKMNYSGSWDEKILKCDKTQYTGLKDKNGKEIYEGDIVYVGGYSYEEPEEEWEGEIGMTPFGWVLLGHDSQDYHDCFNLNEIGGSYKTIYEVIGNGYENPELLEGKKYE